MNHNINKIILLSNLFLSLSCIMNIDTINEEIYSIEWISIDFDQNTSDLYMQVEYTSVKDGRIDSIIVDAVSDAYDSTFILYDHGNYGDIIANNGIYSLLVHTDLPFGNYIFTAQHIGQNISDTNEYSNEEQFLPEMIDVTFRVVSQISNIGVRINRSIIFFIL